MAKPTQIVPPTPNETPATSAAASNIYEKVMEAAHLAASTAPPPRPPRASGAIVLWRALEATEKTSLEPSGSGCEVFWIRRSRKLAFMGGWYAFPGGAISRNDTTVEVIGQPRGIEATHNSAPQMPATLIEGLGELPPDLAPGLLAGTLRELLEETGILPLAQLAAVGSQGGDAAQLAARLAEGQRRLLNRESTLNDIVGELNLTLDASQLLFGGRWLTPPLGPRRFDNRFFLLHWPRERPVQPLAAPQEAELGEWIRPETAIERWRHGEAIAAPPILHILRVLSEEGPPEVDEAFAIKHDVNPRLVARLTQPDEANLGPYRRIEFRPGVITIPLPTATLPPASHTNAYLLGLGDRVLVDPGCGDEHQVDRLVAALAASAAQGHPVREIWLTHHHPDHVGGLLPLCRRNRLPVRAHAATVERLRGLSTASEIQWAAPLVDGERVELGGDPPSTIQVFHTPGHATGHLCFRLDESNSLLAGDMVSSISTIVVDPPEGNMDDYLASLSRLARLGATTLFPGHGPPILDGEAKLEEFIEHRLWREDRILEAWKEGLHHPEAIRPRVYDEVPEPAWPLAERQIQAHLDRLERAGKLD